ncbi:hypothetical protein GCM10007855_00910 [Aliivibrio sifiae]|uniref:Uncharacterized protein n=1 Tax=Aliivibrio sifiae TaxID=566293 RepID=A0ABQ6AG99_9GAMM|nr:hypothetical protein GCM10007855_00910 [Aliivibrio sifiae]
MADKVSAPIKAVEIKERFIIVSPKWKRMCFINMVIIACFIAHVISDMLV